MTKTVERAYDHPPRALVETLLDEAFLAARSAALGGTAPPTVTREGGVVVVRFPRRLPLDGVPGPLRPFVGSGDVVQVDRWETITDERCTAVWTTESAMPGRVDGTYEIVAAGIGSTYRVAATAQVKVPFIGGRLGGEVEDHVVKLIEAELDFLAGYRVE